jgi:hypothetical protein
VDRRSGLSFIRMIKLRLRIHPNQRSSSKGQSLVEITLLFPILLILLSGLVEFGFALNEYLTIQDAVRNAARFASDSDYDAVDSNPVAATCDSADPDVGFPALPCCRDTINFFRQTACLVNQEITRAAPDISLLCLEEGIYNTCRYGVVDPENGDEENLDDIIISVFSVEQDPVFNVLRFGGLNGWSYTENYIGYGVRNQDSRFTIADIYDRLDSSAPNTGYVLVEVIYNYDQKLKLPWITAFIHDPILLHAYAFMPLTSAEPTPTRSP